MRPLIFLMSALMFAGCSGAGDQKGGGPQVEPKPDLSGERQRSLVDKASAGDEAAIKELQQHFFEARDTKNYYFWVEKEADLGKPDAMQRLALRFSELGGKENCEKAEQLLIAALSKKPSNGLRSAIETDLKVMRGEVEGVDACK